MYAPVVPAPIPCSDAAETFVEVHAPKQGPEGQQRRAWMPDKGRFCSQVLFARHTVLQRNTQDSTRHSATAVTIDSGAKQRIEGAGTAIATKPTREQYAIGGTGISCACVPLMVSCSGFGWPMHAQLLRLFVTGGTGVTAQTTAGNLKRHTPRWRASPRARTNITRTGAHEQGQKLRATTRNTQRARGRRKHTKQHTWHPTTLSATK